MSMNDPIANALSKVLNAEKLGKREAVIKPASKVIKIMFKIFNEKGYIGKFNEVKDAKGDFLIINLIGRINKCGVIKPRYSVKKDGYDKFERRYLPSIGFGALLVSTSQGMMTNEEAKEKKLGGKLIAYCY